MNREDAYDTHIAPLMDQIIALCKEHCIPMLCDFALDGDLKCTSALLMDELDPPEGMLRAFDLLKPRPAPFVAFAITREGPRRAD